MDKGCFLHRFCAVFLIVGHVTVMVAFPDIVFVIRNLFSKIHATGSPALDSIPVPKASQRQFTSRALV